MLKQKLIMLSILLFPSCAYALDMKGIAPVNPLDGKSNSYQAQIAIPSFELKRATLTKNSVKNQYAIAMDKFTKSNVRSSYEDFRILIDNVTPNDYVYMKLSQDMASIGFFNLAELAMSRIGDDSLSSMLEDDIKKLYFPSGSLNKNDQIYLAELYSNMRYNNQAKEATAELSKQSSLLLESDYANYVASYGAMQSGDYETAKKFINQAINKNSQNINYKRLKAEIIAQSDNPKTAQDYFGDFDVSNFKTTVFEKEMYASKQYILYKSVKNDYLKKYHLAYYYYDNGELNKAIGVLQTSISGKKNINKDVYALSARVYFDMKEYEKAQNYALKALDIDKKNPAALIVLGDLANRNKNYTDAINYYKKVQGKCSNFVPELRLAQTYLTLNDIQKAKEIYSKILKISSKSFMAYYQMAMLEPDRQLEYLKKAISINPNFNDAWLSLVSYALKKDDTENAISYLRASKYIDDNDYRYYYYLGLVLKNKGLFAQAKENFEYSMKLNPDNELVKKELNI